jgi:multiple sugar transport system substrate-binding protein
MLTRLALAATAVTAMLAGHASAQDTTEITLARFYGACEAEYGGSTDVAAARGECGIMTTLVNKFNATNTQNIVVKPQIIEWGTYYQQLTARIAARDVPTIAILHGSQLGDYTRAGQIEPIEEDLEAVGVDVADMTKHARAGVTFDGKIHALPWDTHSWLWHINKGLFKEAGLVDAAGEPVIPKSVDELLVHVGQMKERTGKPYFSIATIAAADHGNAARTFYTLLHQQNGSLLAAGTDRPDFSQPAVRTAFETIERLAKAGAFTRGLDGAGALGGFIDGQAAVLLTGTWRIDDLLLAATKPQNALQEYTARIFPTLFQQDAVWADNAIWVMLRGGANEGQREAALTFMKFLWDNNFEWARGGGHLPVRQSLLTQYAKLPERENVMRITDIGRAALPMEARRQFGLLAIIGEELNNIINGGKSVEMALNDAQARSDQLMGRR